MKENLKHRVSQIFRGFWRFGKQFKMLENRTCLAHSDYPGMRLLLSCCSSGGLRQPALRPPQAYLWGPRSWTWYSWFKWPSRPPLWRSSSRHLSECSRKRLLWWGLWGSQNTSATMVSGITENVYSLNPQTCDAETSNFLGHDTFLRTSLESM